MKEKSKLPDRPSLLIAVALDDLELVMQDPRYIVDMGDWHNPNGEDSICAVCLAGAVMAKTFDVAIHKEAYPETLLLPLQNARSQARKLEALDSFRRGQVHSGMLRSTSFRGVYGERFMRVADICKKDFDITPYEIDPEQFIEDMDNLRLELEAQGL